MNRFFARATLCLICLIGLVSCGKPNTESADNSEATNSAKPAIPTPSANTVTPGTRMITCRVLHQLVGPEKNEMEMPSDVAVGSDGTVYVVDGVNNRIMIFGSDGQFKSVFGKKGNGNGELSSPLGIAVNDDKVFVADTGNRRIHVFSADGKFLSVIQLETPEAETATDVTDVAIDPNGLFFYAVDNDNHRILTGPLDGKFPISVWGEPGRGERQFRYPFLIDTTARGYVLVVEAINTRVQALNAGGKFVSFVGEWGIRPGQLFRPKGVAAAGDKIFVSDSYLGRIQAFRLDGEFVGELVSSDGKPMKFRGPVGVASGPDNRLYVVEMFANSVCVVQLEGK